MPRTNHNSPADQPGAAAAEPSPGDKARNPAPAEKDADRMYRDAAKKLADAADLDKPKKGKG